MEARTLNCPMCGAAARSNASRCEHCGSRLAVVSCPSCFGMMFQGQKFCPNCGVPAQRAEFEPSRRYPCPRCKNALHQIELGGTPLLECAKCDGLWIDNTTFEEICRTREQQAVYLKLPSLQDPAAGNQVDPVRYLKCPQCATLMNRVNFAGCSGVIVDVCRTHGTWFDHVELRRIIDFIRGGGMDKARSQEMRRLAQERRSLAADRAAAATTAPLTTLTWPVGTSCDELDLIRGLGRAALALLKAL
jgi:Zn-finger nucleic acid-binding protein